MRVTATVLNVRSGPSTDFRIIGKLRSGDSVVLEETHGDWVYAAEPRGWVHRAYLAPIVPSLAPSGAAGLREAFGEPGGPAASAGRVHLPAPLRLGWSTASVTRVACHSALEATFTEVFARIHSSGLWPQLQTFDGIYNFRAQRGGGKTSTHAWGIAVDLNAATNAQGTEGSMPPGIVRIFEEAGFVWGGRWGGSRSDPMHFQFARDY